MDIEARECRTCKRLLSASQFWRQAAKVDGLQSECKDCMRVRSTSYHRDNRKSLRPRNNAVITERRKKYPVRALLNSVRARAKAAGLEFTITEADLSFPERCPILGINLSFGIGQGLGVSSAQKDQRFSIDRIDNRRGYTPDNVVIVSFRANRIKSDATPEELLAVARFYERLAAEKSGQAALSDVQSPKKKETGDLSLCVANG